MSEEEYRLNIKQHGCCNSYVNVFNTSKKNKNKVLIYK